VLHNSWIFVWGLSTPVGAGLLRTTIDASEL